MHIQDQEQQNEMESFAASAVSGCLLSMVFIIAVIGFFGYGLYVLLTL